ncbi:cytochrome P450 [Trametes meyenii]|nr:cytochrome P450 [Trametes meyenii]
MLSAASSVVLLLGILFTLTGIFKRRRSIQHIRGPPSTSLLLGHDYDLSRQNDVGDLEFKWMQEYGPTWRTRGALLAYGLMTADPKALQHVFQKAASHFIKKPSHNHMSWLGLGPGILWSQALQLHSTMIPGLSKTRRMAPLPTPFTQSLSLQTPFSEHSKDIDFMLPKTIMLYRAIWDYLPHGILKLSRYTPAEPFVRLRHLSNFFTQYSQRIVSEKRPALSSQDAKTKDIMSILNATGRRRAPRRNTIAIGGHETTSTTLALLLYELARNQEYQARLREDVRAARARVNARGDADFTLEDLDNIPTLVNTIKVFVQETLRMHPIVSQLPRIAVEDEVIPLAHPIASTSGETITEIPINKGQVIVGSFAAYHRLPEVWGEDAHVWNPDRFTKIDSEKQTKVGVFSNFRRNECLHWLEIFIIEQQALVAEVVDAFQFSLPSDAGPEKTDLVRAPAVTTVGNVCGGWTTDSAHFTPVHLLKASSKL